MEPNPGEAVLPRQRIPVIRLMHVPEKRDVKHIPPIFKDDYNKSRTGNNKNKSQLIGPKFPMQGAKPRASTSWIANHNLGLEA
jgi:hypothetical protein